MSTQAGSIFTKKKYYAIEAFPADPEMRTYHSRLELMPEGSGNRQCASRGVLESMLDFSLVPVLKLALTFPGVEVGEISAYKLSIRKSPMFEWDEIEEKILALFEGIRTAMEQGEVIKCAQ